MLGYGMEQEFGADQIFNIRFIGSLEGYACADLSCGLLCVQQQTFNLETVSYKDISTIRI